MRTYQTIWNKIKTTGTCAITALPKLHPRIIKAVVKEKWMDTGYKLAAQERRELNKLQYKVEGNKIIFTLTTTIDISQLTPEEL